MVIFLSACSIFHTPLFSMMGKKLSKSCINRIIKSRLRKVKKGKTDKAILDKPISNKAWNVVPLLYRTYHEKTTGLDPVEQLLAAGADPNIKNGNYDRLLPFKTPLVNAVDRGTSKGVALLLQHGACASENSFLIYYLTTQAWRDACPDEKLYQRATDLMTKMKLLLANGADPNYKAWAPPLYRLVINIAVIKEFLRCGSEKFSPFKLAYGFCTNMRLLDMLLYHGANPYSQNTRRKTAIDCAQESDCQGLAYYLEQAPKRNVTMLTALLRRVRTKSGQPLPFEVAHKIAEYRYQASTVIHDKNEIVYARENDKELAKSPELEYNLELLDI